MRKRKKLTKRQQQQMRTHRKHHTKRHLKMMRNKMLAGSSFKAAHRAAQRKIGRQQMALSRRQRSLRSWSKQKWRTKSGKKSSVTGERYLPSAAIKALSPAEYAATTRAKRRDKRKGKQFSKQPKRIAKKVRRFRFVQWCKTVFDYLILMLILVVCSVCWNVER